MDMSLSTQYAPLMHQTQPFDAKKKAKKPGFGWGGVPARHYLISIILASHAMDASLLVSIVVYMSEAPVVML